MTAPTDPQIDRQWASPAERRAAARDAYERSVTAGDPLTPAALAGGFGRSVRWAQERIAEVRNEHSTDPDRRRDESGERSGRSDGRSTDVEKRSGKGPPVRERSAEPRSAAARRLHRRRGRLGGCRRVI